METDDRLVLEAFLRTIISDLDCEIVDNNRLGTLNLKKIKAVLTGSVFSYNFVLEVYPVLKGKKLLANAKDGEGSEAPVWVIAKNLKEHTPYSPSEKQVLEAIFNMTSVIRKLGEYLIMVAHNSKLKQ